MVFYQIVVTLGLTLVGSQAMAASDDAQALQQVQADLAINNTRDLDFGLAAKGAGPAVIDAQANVTDSASFAISGDASTAYTVSVPANGVVVMKKNGGGTSNTEIAVNDFGYFSVTSASASSASTNASGVDELRIGATRDPIDATEEAGDFVATFTVSVVY
jgi:hypothetical protein